jgi:DNA modification methylase
MQKKLKTSVIHNGDSVKLLNDSAAESIDLIIADPPYNIGYEYDVYNDNRSDNEYLQWSKQWIGACTRVLKQDGAFWIAIGDEYAAELKIIADECGLKLRNWVIWYYTFGVHCTTKFSRSHTHFLYFVKNTSRVKFNADDVRVPSARQSVYKDLRANGTGKLPDNTWILRPQDIGDDVYFDNQDTWYIPRIAGTFKERADFHGCQLPEQLLGRIIKSCSNVEDTVLDPFAGTGSSLVTAKKLGRKWVGIELSPEYSVHATARLKAVQQGDPLDGAPEPITGSTRTKIRPKQVRAPEELDQVKLMEAFLAVPGEPTVDWLVADPILDQQFIDECSKRRLPGKPYIWNKCLMALRKSGKHPELKGRDAGKIEFEWSEADPYEFACEMALRRAIDAGYYGLDDLLCDPEAAARFDADCRTLCPGYSAFQYRWTAFKFRKSIKSWRNPPESPIALRLGDPVPLLKSSFDNEAAVYLIEANSERPAFAGYTENLGARIEATKDAFQALLQWMPQHGEWTVRVSRSKNLIANSGRVNQQRIVQERRPRLNFLMERGDDQSTVNAS